LYETKYQQVDVLFNDCAGSSFLGTEPMIRILRIDQGHSEGTYVMKRRTLESALAVPVLKSLGQCLRKLYGKGEIYIASLTSNTAKLKRIGIKN
jgi:hypothetical protein